MWKSLRGEGLTAYSYLKHITQPSPHLLLQKHHIPFLYS